MAALASTVPTAREPDETAVTVRSVPATEATPTKVPVPVGQKAPAAHAAPSGDDAPATHVVPARHGFAVALALADAVQKPAAHADAHAVPRPVAALKVPASHGVGVTAPAAPLEGQK
jgi:hypothetical protein